MTLNVPFTFYFYRSKLPKSLAYCNEILRELFNKRHSAYAWPFYKPVDASALGLHDYHTIISKPMDLGTVKNKMDSRNYVDAEEFHEDVVQIFKNCYIYNPDTHDVVAMARKLEEVSPPLYDLIKLLKSWQFIINLRTFGGLINYFRQSQV